MTEQEWQDILWREWRRTRDDEYARWLYALLGSVPARGVVEIIVPLASAPVVGIGCLAATEVRWACLPEKYEHYGWQPCVLPWVPLVVVAVGVALIAIRWMGRQAPRSWDQVLRRVLPARPGRARRPPGAAAVAAQGPAAPTGPDGTENGPHGPPRAPAGARVIWTLAATLALPAVALGCLLRARGGLLVGAMGAILGAVLGGLLGCRGAWGFGILPLLGSLPSVVSGAAGPHESDDPTAFRGWLPWWTWKPAPDEVAAALRAAEAARPDAFSVLPERLSAPPGA